MLEFALETANADFGGVNLIGRRRSLEYGGYTSHAVSELHETELAMGEGPSVQLTTSSTSLCVAIPDVVRDLRWPAWTAAATRAGISSALILRMDVRKSAVGTLALYGAQPRAFNTLSDTLRVSLAKHAAVAVATARHEEFMIEAVDSRKFVGQAVGILMERYDIDESIAFRILKEYSQDNNLRVHDTAEQLIMNRRLRGLPRDIVQQVSGTHKRRSLRVPVTVTIPP
ncbi:ANTAR domain-containing protein [Kribbella sp. CA-253562]|uniref:ANTAR domain-containing protein n=1 Tax=Kribbella sp. CA-253562 TaxID=3239942 RepID=UPI003D93E33D